VNDAYGRLTRVTEPGGGTTTYTYNTLGNLASLTDAAGNSRAFTYDGLGRRLTAQDLHATSDSTFGTWAYTYDAVGNLTSKLDPRGQTINYTYDDLNRVLTEEFAGAAGIEVAYTYDTCTFGKGRLCSITTAAATQGNQYDAMGNLTREVKTIGSTNYQTDYTYDRAGNQRSLVNPDGSQVQYTYNTAGQLEQVQRKEATDGGLTNVVSNFDYSPTGSVATQVNANGTITTNTYDTTKLYRLTRKLTVNSGGTRLQDMTYTYDAVGNITQLVDASATNAAKTTAYTYDSLNRLLTATTTGAANGQNYSQTYTYDAIGNMLTGPAGAYTYAGTGYANPHAVTSVTNGSTTTTYTYDNNGNMTNDGSRTYTWDYANRLTQVTMPGTSPAPVTTTFYAVSGDGSSLYNASTSWDITHDALTGRTASATAGTLGVQSGKDSKGKFCIERGFVPFDTSTLPDNATITSATLKMYVNSKLNGANDGTDWITLVQGLELSTTTLSTTDYDLAGTINAPMEGVDPVERKDITSITTGAYLAFNLNTVGLGWVSKTGPTKLALREGHDVLDVPFSPITTQASSGTLKLAASSGGGGAGSTSAYNQIQIRTSEYSGTTSDPVLEITYTLPPPTVATTYAYDAGGQRVKVVSGGTTTVYPTAAYSTDGTKKTKHIASIATVETVGSVSTPYYLATDHINSSSVISSQAGTLQELTDYYPFGSIRLDEKASGFSEQRKYIGEEYDQDTGLNYLNARYYNSTLGKFISQDPLAIEALQTTDNKKFVALISSPQNWNTYSYALNNPLVASDPSGLLTIVIPGTWYNSNDWSEKGTMGGFLAEVHNTFNDKMVVENNKTVWSGGDNDLARQNAATAIAQQINDYPFALGEKLNIVGHSHGGNVANLVTREINHKVDNLVTLGAPVIGGYGAKRDNVINQVNVYSIFDPVQKGGGSQITTTGVAGFAIGNAFAGLRGGLMGWKLGNNLGWGQFGIANRSVDGADNINVTWQALNPFTAHGSYFSSSVWSRIDKKLNK
jgi:RHS repeat-associated protein